MTFRPVLSAVATLVLLAPAALPAWSFFVHRATGEIADAHLTPEAREAVYELLEPGETLASISTWADEVRRERPVSGPWHYVNYSLDLDEPDFDVMVEPAEGNVVRAIVEQLAIATDGSVDRQLRGEALKYVVHFIGDVHQPLHAGTGVDRGGNRVQVRLGGEDTNLHAAWDGGIWRAVGISETDALMQEMGPVVEGVHRAAETGRLPYAKPYDWMVESHRLARQYVYGELPGFQRSSEPEPSTTDTITPPMPRLFDPSEITERIELDNDYLNMAIPVMRLRVAAAGLRIAHTLNEAFAPAEAPVEAAPATN